MNVNIDSDAVRLEANARHHKFDPHLDRVADLLDGPPEGWTHLHPKLIDAASIYRDFRASYRAAVAASAIPDDRGPNSDPTNERTTR